MILATLYRFGCSIEVLSESKTQAKRQLMKEYKDTFYKYNQCNPTRNEVSRAADDIEFHEYEVDTVYWF